MSLTTALNTARSALTVGRRTDRRCLAQYRGRQRPELYAPVRQSHLAPAAGGSRIDHARSTNKVLFETRLGATSEPPTQQSIAAALDRLHNTVGDPELDRSPAALVGKFADAMQRYADRAPNDNVAAPRPCAAGERPCAGSQ